MTPEVAAAVAEAEERIRFVQPDAPTIDHRSAADKQLGHWWNRPPPPGSDFERHINVEHPAWAARCAREDAIAERHVKPPAAPHPGPCATCGATPRVHRTRLCSTCYAAVIAAAKADAGRGRRPAAPIRPKPPAGPQAHEIDAADVFRTTEPRVTAEVRAAHMARWVHRIGAPVRRVDAVRIAGGNPSGSSASPILDVATERGWVVRGERGAVAPGNVMPPNDHTNNATKDH